MSHPCLTHVSAIQFCAFPSLLSDPLQVTQIKLNFSSSDKVLEILILGSLLNQGPNLSATELAVASSVQELAVGGE